MNTNSPTNTKHTVPEKISSTSNATTNVANKTLDVVNNSTMLNQKKLPTGQTYGHLNNTKDDEYISEMSAQPLNCMIYLTCKSGNELLTHIKNLSEEAKKVHDDAVKQANNIFYQNVEELKKESNVDTMCKKIKNAALERDTAVNTAGINKRKSLEESIKQSCNIPCDFGNDNVLFTGKVHNDSRIIGVDLLKKQVIVQLSDSENTKKTINISSICIGSENQPRDSYNCSGGANKIKEPKKSKQNDIKSAEVTDSSNGICEYN